MSVVVFVVVDVCGVVNAVLVVPLSDVEVVHEGLLVLWMGGWRMVRDGWVGGWVVRDRWVSGG